MAVGEFLSRRPVTPPIKAHAGLRASPSHSDQLSHTQHFGHVQGDAPVLAPHRQQVDVHGPRLPAKLMTGHRKIWMIRGQPG